MNQCSEELQALINALPDDLAAPSASYEDVRRVLAPLHGHPVSDALVMETRDYGGIRCGQYTVEDSPARFTAFHCHGGAFVSCPLDEYHFYAELIAHHTGCAVVMPDYRLAPEHPFPAAHDDCFNAYRGLLDAGADPRTLILMGDSCGGSLALGLLLRARDEGLPLPIAFIPLTGWFDLSVAGEPVPGDDPFVEQQWVRNRGQDYTAGKMALDDPRVSPAYADLAGLPPMYLQVGQYDTVREGTLTLGSRALRAGSKVLLESWPGAIHGWHGLVNARVPEASAAWAAIRRYIEDLDIEALD